MSSKFSPYLCGLRKNPISQYSLLKMIEVWTQHHDKGNLVGAVSVGVGSVKTIRHYQPRFILGKTRTLRPEAITRRCSLKKVFLKFFKNSQETPVAKSLI